jgi:hypothetical protein
MQATLKKHVENARHAIQEVSPLVWLMLAAGILCLLYSLRVEPVVEDILDISQFEAFQGHVAPLPAILIITGAVLVIGAGTLALLRDRGWPGLFVLLLAGLIIRFTFAFGFFGTADMKYYAHWARVIERDGVWMNFYSRQLSNWGPLPILTMALWDWVANRTGIPFYGLAATLPILSDLGIGAMIYVIAGEEGLPTGKRWAASALYLLNPISILVSGMHPQFGAVYILPVIVAFYLLVYRNRYMWAGIVLGMGISVVIFPVLFLPAFLAHLDSWRKRAIFLVMIGIPPGVVFAPYLITDFPSVYQMVFKYGSEFGTWGSSFLLRLLAEKIWAELGKSLIGYVRAYGNYGLLLMLVVLGFTAFRRMKLSGALILTVIIFYLNPIGFTTPYIILLVPFLILEFETKTKYWYLALGSLYAVTGYLSQYYYPRFILDLLPSWPRPTYLLSLPIWAMCVWELGRRLLPYLRGGLTKRQSGQRAAVGP